MFSFEMWMVVETKIFLVISSYVVQKKITLQKVEAMDFLPYDVTTVLNVSVSLVTHIQQGPPSQDPL